VKPAVPKRFRLVLVTWIDAYHSGGWKSEPDTVGERMNQHTAGFIVRESRSFIHVAQTIDTQDHPRFSDTMCIPRSTVRRIRRLT
jgi:hypothetical protein